MVFIDRIGQTISGLEGHRAIDRSPCVYGQVREELQLCFAPQFLDRQPRAFGHCLECDPDDLPIANARTDLYRSDLAPKCVARKSPMAGR